MNANDSFILRHRTDDVHRLALEPVPEGVDIKYCLQQIEGWQTALHKLPRWADTEGIIFPPRLSMEQCSSQHTASYKCQVVERLFPEPESRGLMADLTGGFGVDFSFIAPLFQEAVYVEEQPSLCELARHNLPLLGLPKAKVFTPDEAPTDIDYTLIYLDPSRRDMSGRKVVALEECSPNVVALQDYLLSKAETVLVKLSPMLDISLALKKLKGVREIHTIGVEGECKELLFVLSSHSGGNAKSCRHEFRQLAETPNPAGNNSASWRKRQTAGKTKPPAGGNAKPLGKQNRQLAETPNRRENETASWRKRQTAGKTIPPAGGNPKPSGKQFRQLAETLNPAGNNSASWRKRQTQPETIPPAGGREITFHCANLGTESRPFVCSQTERETAPQILPENVEITGGFLHEPNACILKAGVQEALAGQYNIMKLHPQSNLYFSTHPLEGAQGLFRSFQIKAWSDFGKKGLRQLLANLRQANLTIRNFPTSVAALRKKLCLAEGGEDYLFATTNSKGQHILIHTLKI